MRPIAVEIRPLRDPAEYRACVELQHETWGRGFTEAVPATILRVSQRVGGLMAGAFDETGRLVGFVFGVAALVDGRPAHWSHMLAVAREARDGGVGRRLKEYQRTFLLANGIETAYWTYDPLVARNAHLNLNRLGARVTSYVPDMYPDSDSALHAGLGTDRFVVAWRVAERDVAGDGVADASVYAVLPVANPGGVAGAAFEDGESQAVRVEIPPDIYEVRRQSPERAAEWRRTTRAVLEPRLERGGRVVAFYRDGEGRGYYVVTGGGEG